MCNNTKYIETQKVYDQNFNEEEGVMDGLGVTMKDVRSEVVGVIKEYFQMHLK